MEMLAEDRKSRSVVEDMRRVRSKYVNPFPPDEVGRGICKNLVTTYASEQFWFSPDRAALEMKALKAAVPQFGLTSLWAYRGSRVLDPPFVPSEVSKTTAIAYLKHATDRLVSVGLSWLDLSASFRIDKSHGFPTLSSGRTSFAHCLAWARSDLPLDFPIRANFRHGSAATSFDSILGLERRQMTTYENRVLVRLVLAVDLVSNLALTPHADIATNTKSIFGCGSVKTDAQYMLGQISLNDRLDIGLGLKDKPSWDDYQLERSNLDGYVFTALDFSHFDLSQGRPILDAAADVVYQSSKWISIPWAEIGMSDRFLEVAKGVTDRPVLAPSGVLDPYHSVLFGPPGQTLLSGIKTTASFGSVCNFLVTIHALAHAYSSTVDEICAQLMDDLSSRDQVFRLSFFSDDTMHALPLNWRFGGRTRRLSLSLLKEAFTSLGYVTKEDPTVWLQHHIIPAVGIFPVFSRRLVRTFFPEYGAPQTLQLARLSIASKLLGLHGTRSFFNVELGSSVMHDFRQWAFRKLGIDVQPLDRQQSQLTRLGDDVRDDPTSRAALIQMNDFEVRNLGIDPDLDKAFKGHSFNLASLIDPDVVKVTLAHATPTPLIPPFRPTSYNEFKETVPINVKKG